MVSYTAPSRVTQTRRAHDESDRWGRIEYVSGVLTLVKRQVDAQAHFLEKLQSYCSNRDLLESLRARGGGQVDLWMTNGRVLRASLQDFDLYGIAWRKGGPDEQVALPLRYWQEVNGPHFGEAA